MKISRRKLILGVGAAGVLAGGASVLVPMVRRDGKFVESTSRAKHVDGTEGALPKESDAVIIGGGMMGIMTAINLAERGMSVTVLEKVKSPVSSPDVLTARSSATKHQKKFSRCTITAKCYGAV